MRSETQSTVDLASYVPPFVRRWLTETPDAQHVSSEGTLVVAEMLRAAPGAVLNDALSVTAVRGGVLLKFTNDRLVLFFTGGDHVSRGEATANDIAATFHASIGVDSGPVEFFLLGCSHHELFVSGATVRRALERLQAARPGEIATRESVSHVVELSTAARGVFIAGTNDDRTILTPEGSTPRRFVPEVVRRLAAQHADEPLATREMSVGALHLANLDDLFTEVGAATTTRHLSDLIVRIQRAFVEHDIAFTGSDIATGGPVIRCAVGTLRENDDDEARMLRALREITDYPSPIELRTGVDRGTVTLGILGQGSRRSFVMSGDPIRTATDLTADAGASEILATPAFIALTETPIAESADTTTGSPRVFRISKPTRHHRGVANMLLNLGTLSFEHHDFGAARHYFEDALALSRRNASRPDEAQLLVQLGLVALAMGDAELAMVRSDESLTIRRELGDDLGIAESLTLLGRARYADGDSASARVCWKHAIETLRRMNATPASAAAAPSV